MKQQDFCFRTPCESLASFKGKNSVMNLSKHKLTLMIFCIHIRLEKIQNFRFHELKSLGDDIKFEHGKCEKVSKLELNHWFSDRASHILSSFFDEYVMSFDNILVCNTYFDMHAEHLEWIYARSAKDMKLGFWTEQENVLHI